MKTCFSKLLLAHKIASGPCPIHFYVSLFLFIYFLFFFQNFDMSLENSMGPYEKMDKRKNP